MSTRWFALLLLCLIAVPVRAQDTPIGNGPSYNLRGLVDQAVRQSEWLRAQTARIGEKEYAEKQSGVWQNPSVGVAGGVKEAAGQQGQILEATVSQPIFFPGKQGLKKEIANLDTRAAKLDYTMSELAVTSEVVQAAFRYVIHQQNKLYATERQERFRLIRGYLSSRVFASPQKRAESSIVDSRVRNLTAETLQIDAALHTSLVQLQFYVPNVPLTNADQLNVELPWLTGQKPLDATTWENKILEKNTALVSGLLAISGAKKEHSLARKEAWPDFAVSGFYTHEDAGAAENAFGGGLTVPIPLWNRNTWASKSAAKRIEVTERTYELHKLELIATARRLLAEYEAARKIVAQYPRSIFAEREKLIKKTEVEFRKGRIDLLTFLELDGEIADTYTRALSAQVTLAEKIAALALFAADGDFVNQISEF